MIKLQNSPEKCRDDNDNNAVSTLSKDNEEQGEMRNITRVLCASETVDTQLESNGSSTDQSHDGSENNTQFKENKNKKHDSKTADSERKSVTEGSINLKSDDTYSSSQKQQTSSTCKIITTDGNTNGSTDSNSGRTTSASESNKVNSKETHNGKQTVLNDICLEKQKDKSSIVANAVQTKSSGDACKSTHSSKRINSDSKRYVDENKRRKGRRSRSVSADYERKRSKHSKNYDRHKRDRSKSLERRNGRRSRSVSVDYEKKRTRNSKEYDDRYKYRRSKSLERRREERKRRHAEKRHSDNERSSHIEKRKRNQPDDHNQNSDSKSSAQTGTSSPNQIDVDNITVTNPQARITERQRRTVDLLTSRTGGAYIPPAKLRLMQAEITDKSSAAYQRIAWEALKKSIHGFINKVNVDNIAIITRELLRENIIRGRGLLCRSIIQAQAASPTFTHVYAALVSIINSKFPNIGLLLLKRLVIQFKRAFRRNDKMVCLSATRFIAHLMNQRVSHEILALEILTLLVETPTDDSVEVAIAFLKECGMKLTEVTSKGIGAIFEMLKNILHEGKLDKRVQYMIEVVFQVRKDGFKDHQSVIESLELVEENDQLTHLLMLDDAVDPEDALNAFKFDEQYEANEEKYKGLSREILGSDASDSNGSDSDNSEPASGTDNDSDNSDSDDKGKSCEIIDNTETNLIALRRTIYLTINSSLDYEECAHKLMKMQLKPGQEIELCHMFLDCCAEQRTYEKFYGLLAQRFCAINKIYIEPFEEIFKDTYKTTHRLDTNRLRNVSKFFAHLLFTDAIGWDVFDCIKLNEEDTTSSSRIFIKILFQELAEYMGLSELNKKLKDEVLEESLVGLFPKDNPRNTRFSINFFTSIGLGGLTDELRQFLKNAPKSVPAINAEILANKPIKESSSSSSTSISSSSDSSTSSGSESSSSSSQSDNSSSDDSLDTSALMSSSSSPRKSHENEQRKKKEKHTTNKNNKGEKSKACKVSQKKQKAKKAEISPESKSSLSTSDSSSDSNTDTSSGTSSDSSSDHKSTQARKSPTRTSKKKVKSDNRIDYEADRTNHMKKSVGAKKDNGKHAERKSRNEDTNREMELRRRRDEREKRHREKDKEEQKQRLHGCDLKRDSNLERSKKRERKEENCRELQSKRSPPTNNRHALSKGRKVRDERERHRSASRNFSRSRSQTPPSRTRCRSRGHKNTFVNKSR